MKLPTVYDIDPAIVDKLNEALKLERTVCEGYHDQEHSYIATGWDGLRDWFDNRVEDSRKKRRKLVDWLFMAGEVPGTESLPYDVADPNDPDAAISQVFDCENKLYDIYADLIQLSMDKGDFCTAKVGNCLMNITRKTIKKAVKQQNVLAKVGPANYLQSMM